MRRGQHHAVADVALHTRAHDAAGNEVERRFNAVDDQRMARIVSTLKAHHTLGGFGQPVDQLALAFIAPLGTYNHNVASSGGGLFFDHHLVELVG